MYENKIMARPLVLTFSKYFNSFVFVYILFVIVISIDKSFCNRRSKVINYVNLYAKSEEHVKSKDWNGLFKDVSQAIADYKQTQEIRIDCSLSCKSGDDPLSILVFLEQSFCIRNCLANRLKTTSPSADNYKVEKAFEFFEPYNLLQLAAYELKDFQLAASALYTYHLRNPNNQEAVNNIKNLVTVKGFEKKWLVDMLERPFESKWKQVATLYQREKYVELIKIIELGINEIVDELEKCRALCDFHLIDMDVVKNSYFYYVITGAFIDNLTCKSNCTLKVLTIDGIQNANLIRDLFDYLQIAYYKVGNMVSAAESSATYLLYSPNDERQLSNMKFYQDALGLQTIEPRRIIQQLLEKDKMEQELLTLSRDRNQFVNVNGFSNDAETKIGSGFSRKDDDYVERIIALNKREKIAIFANGHQLKGENRIALDGLLNEEECNSLTNFATFVTNKSKGKKMIDLNELIEMARKQEIESNSVEMLIRIAKKGQRILQTYFNSTLYLHSSQLLCQEVSESDTHEKPDGCKTVKKDCKESVVYSSLIFLNKKVDMGNFMFYNHINNDMESKVAMKCGRFIAFNYDNFYASKIISDGELCQFKIDYTLEEKNKMEIATDSIIKYSLNKKFLDLIGNDNVKIVALENELNGSDRFVIDNVLSEKECEDLIKLADVGAVVGDGYAEVKTVTSPHTNRELFAGLTIQKAAELAKTGSTSKESAEIYWHKSDRSRQYVEKYFRKDDNIYFDYTHLVCRSAINGVQENRQDLSHPIHADNCIMQADKTCIRNRPAYTQRDYSALLYLNSKTDFEGGNFFFAEKNHSIQAVVEPKCGRLVGFDAGLYHGVLPVTKGRRCAVAMWFTLDSQYDELSRKIALRILENVADNREQVAPPRAFGPKIEL